MPEGAGELRTTEEVVGSLYTPPLQLMGPEAREVRQRAMAFVDETRCAKHLARQR
jgi:hypothetical protein